MLFSILLIAVALQGTLALPQPDPTLTNYTRAFSEAQVVPDVLASFNPTALLDVEYTDPATKQSVKVPPGVHLTTEQTPNAPTFFLTSGDPSLQNQTFVLAMVDPDAPFPGNRSLSQIRHLIAGDFSLNKNASQPTQLLNASAAISEYVGPSPPAGSDPHRYVILVYVQPNHFADTASTLANASSPITNFNLTTFATSARLGDPIAGTFFLTGPAGGTKTSGTSPTPTPASASNGALMGRQGMMGVLGLTIATVSGMN